MSEGSLRVALLARAGDACDRIGGALREAGAELVLVADPTDAGEAAVREAGPQAIVVALEPAIEDALDAFDALLSDPAYMVIFEEAELAAQRAGWDAARWLRHLAAKLHRHADVLPPGAEDDADLQPSPGPLPDRKEVVDMEQAIAAFTDEAQQHAGEVPRDTGIEGVPGLAAGNDAAPSSFDPVAFETGGLSLASAEAVPASDPVSPGTGDATDADADGAGGLALADDDAPSPFDPVAFESGDASVADADAGGESPAGSAGFDLSGLSLVDDAAEEQVPESIADAAVPVEDAIPLDSADDAAGDSGLTLAGTDEVFTTTQAGGTDAADAPALGQGLSGLSLADPESYGHGPERGAVLVEAGLGGPDAVRQLLGAIPAGFPRPVVVRLHLDGGRYDRLVRQMERAAALNVQLAEADAEAVPGQVYFLPPELGLRRDKGRLVFDAGTAGELLPEALPPADSAVLLLSGASRRIADATAAAEWSVALVAGQSPEGSYDPDATLALLEHGGASGTPAELAAMLASRWPPPDAPAPDLEELQP